MALFNNWPWTKYNEYNLAWLLKNQGKNDKEIAELEKQLNEELEQTIINYINEHLSQFILGAMYIEENKTIKLQQAVVIGDSDHVYNSNSEQIIVMEGR